MAELILSDKYKAFLKTAAPVEFLEGTTAAGKTTVGMIKFVLMCAKSEKKLHIISAKDTGTAEKNLINKELGVLDIFGGLLEYNGNGSKDDKIPHLILHTSHGDKTLYILGYGNKAGWKRALGGQYGCLYIDEINTADIDYIQEASMRCDYLLATLNPDSPDLPVYSRYINHSRPLPQYASDVPGEIMAELETQKPKPGWTYWFFTMDDNAGLTEAKKARIIENVPPGTKLYKNKIEGLRGRATGLVFANFDRRRNVITRKQLIDDINAGRIRFRKFSAGLDTSYSSHSSDTIAMTFIGITQDRKMYLLAERVINNKDKMIPLAPSDTAARFVDFLESCRGAWGFCRDTYIDSADQATLTELAKYKRNHRGVLFNFINSYKRPGIIDRINVQLGWLQAGDFVVLDECTEYIKELDSYSWQEEKDIPEDGHDHVINSCQYAFLPYLSMIGSVVGGVT